MVAGKKNRKGTKQWLEEKEGEEEKRDAYFNQSVIINADMPIAIIAKKRNLRLYSFFSFSPFIS